MSEAKNETIKERLIKLLKENDDNCGCCGVMNHKECAEEILEEFNISAKEPSPET